MIDRETYERERAIVDKANAYARETMAKRGKGCNYLTAEEAQHPDYAACDNAMRGRVEQFQLLDSPPDRFCAYLGKGDDTKTQGWTVTTWTGDVLGRAVVLTQRKTPHSFASDRYCYGRARIADRNYAWRGAGEGMLCHLKALKA